MATVMDAPQQAVEQATPGKPVRPVPQPVMHFEIFRRIAETASGMRYADTYYEVVFDKEGNESINIYVDTPPPPSGNFVIKCDKWPRPPVPTVECARIKSDESEKWHDLMNLEVPEEELQGWKAMGPDGKKTIHADAVFWSAAAVEKFLVPYYSSTYGSMAPRVVEQLLNVFVPPDSPELRGNGMAGVMPFEQANDQPTALATVPTITVDQPADLPFAVVHLPNSEYTAEPGSTPLFTLHRSGKVKRFKVPPE